MTPPSDDKSASLDAPPRPAIRAEPADPVLGRPVPELADEYLGWLITSLSVRLSRSASSFYSRQWGIGTTEYRLVLAIGHEGPCSAVRAAAAADIDKAAASRGLQLLQQAGLVELAKHGREMEICLTPAGQALHVSLRAATARRETLLAQGLSDSDRRRLIADLRRLIDNLASMNDG